MSTITLLPYFSQPAQEAPVQSLQPYKVSRRRKIILWSVLAAGILASFGFGFITAGTNGVVFTAAALIPFAVLIFLSFLFTRRSEVSLELRLAALIWGAAGSTTLTFAIIGAQNAIIGSSNSTDSVVVQAAIVEEVAKAAFLFFLFWFMRRLISSPIIGASLGVLVGAGFAFLENILYFSMAYSQGGWEGFMGTFIARAGMSFFLHSMATMFTGLFLGYVMSKRPGFLKGLLLTHVGLIAAMTVHGLWNGFSSLTTDGSWYWLYFFFWLPFVAGTVIIIVGVRRYSTRKTHEVLMGLVKQGVIRAQQVERMRTRKSRKQVYRTNDSGRVIQWEESLRLAQFWQREADQLSKKPRNFKKYDKRMQKKQRQLLRLSQVSEVV